MSPVETQQLSNATAALSLKAQSAGPLKVQPLKRNFSLDAYKNFKVQPHIGTEFAKGTIQIRDILKAPNADELIKDFAVLTSERNVVFLRDQDVTFEEQAEFIDRLGRAGGKPATSGLHTHPLTDLSDELGEKRHDINSEKFRKYGSGYGTRTEFHSRNWHSDITFEPVPSDYAALKLNKLPTEGGDTLWASAYEVYERLSPAFQKFLEGLTATHSAAHFHQAAAAAGTTLVAGPRGAPEDVGTELIAIHPVIRTNPVTGWKGVFANKGFTQRINELSKDESDLVLAHLFDLAVQNHDLQVRFKWNQNDIAVWDNRSSFHSATVDFDDEVVLRQGDRATSLGERPVL
ncbi:alpha-ketoglutarate-dependent taurine dioxygenase [Obelidium mucronatum]|nr:alpha-ketoglutarate-dependent taurine dioxygenase [Obelidium mucronatum]